MSACGNDYKMRCFEGIGYFQETQRQGLAHRLPHQLLGELYKLVYQEVFVTSLNGKTCC